MTTSYTVSPKYTTSFTWIITDFDDHLRVYRNSQSKYELSSAEFSLKEANEMKFTLRLDHHTELKPDYWDLYIYCTNFKFSPTIECCLYLLDSDNKEHNKKSFIKPITVSQPNWGFPDFCETSELIKNGLLLTNTLTICCKLTIYNKPENITPFYQQKYDFTIKEQFKDAFRTQKGCDFTFDVVNQQFKVHKCILKIRSPVFETMFDIEMMEKQNNCAKINDIRPEIFNVMLEFIYTDKINGELSVDDIIELLSAADKYMISYLKEVCGEMLFKLINSKNTMKILIAAEKYDIKELISSSKAFITANKQQILDNICIEDYFSANPNHISMFFSKTMKLSENILL